MNFSPVVDKSVSENHALRQIERESRGFIAECKQSEFATEFTVVSLLCLFNHVDVCIQFFL